MIFDTAKYTNPGGREINEDSMLCGNGVWVVADGLGGHADGEKASAEAVRYMEENCCGGYTDKKVSELLEGANTAVCNLDSSGCSTVAAAFAENGVFHMANVGDSRVYYFRDGKIFAQTKDHSVCQASVDMGMLSSEDIRGSEDRSSLLKVLGSESSLNIKKSYPAIEIKSGDAFIVCSDGFWEYVLETEMEADLLKSDTAEAWMSHMLKRHLLRAENHGDNYTVICGFIFREASDAEAEHKGNIRPVIAASAAVAVLAVAVGVFALGPFRNDNTVDDVSKTVSGTSVTSAESETEEIVPADAEITGMTDISLTEAPSLSEPDTEPVLSDASESEETSAPETSEESETTTTAPEVSETTPKTTTTAPETSPTTPETTTTAPETSATTPKTTTTAPETSATTPKTTTTAPETSATTPKTTTTSPEISATTPETTTTAPETSAPTADGKR